MIRRFLRSPIFITTVIVTVATLWLYGPIFRGQVPLPTQSVTGLTWGAPDKPAVQSIFRDRIVQAYPYHLFAVSEIQAGRFPWWNNLIFAGTPFFANGQSGILSLFKLPFWWLPPLASFEIITLLQSAVAAAGFALVGRKLRWHPAAGTVMALAFTLSAPFVLRMTVTTMSAVFATLPFVLWAVLRLHERLNWKRATVLAALVAAMIFTGHVQLAAFGLGLTAVWIVAWWSRDAWRRRVLLFGAALVLGLGLTAVQLVPLKDALNQAYRQPHEVSWSKILNPTRLFRVSVKDGAGLLTMIDQNIWGNEAHYRGPANYLEGNLYLGPLALLAALASLLAWRKRVWRVLAILVVLEAGLFIFPGWWDLVGKLAPWLTVTPVWRTSFLLAFTVALLAGLGVHELAQRRWRRWLWPAVGVMAAVTLWQWWGILPFAPRATLFPPSALLSKTAELTQDGSRVWTPNGALDQFMPYGVPVSVGYDSVYPSSYLELWTANSERIEKRNQLVPINPNDAVLRVTASNVLLTSDPVPAGWREIMTEGKWHLAQRETPLPAVHAVRRLITSSDSAQVGTIDPFTAATTDGVVPQIDANAKVDVQVISRTATTLRLQVRSTGATAIATNMQSYPGWKLMIDGNNASAAALTVNHAFLGAAVNEGKHTVEFYYAPRSFVVGLVISLISLVLLVMVGWLMPRQKT